MFWEHVGEAAAFSPPPHDPLLTLALITVAAGLLRLMG